MIHVAPLVLVAAGGTGGHLFPAEALSVALARRAISVELATDVRAGRYGHAFPARAMHIIPSATVRGRDPLSLARTVATLAWGIGKAWRLLGRIRPSVVVGFGGYPSIPPLLAATLRGIPTVIHEQNGVMGRANRFLAKGATAIATGFPGVVDDNPQLAAKASQVGNPVRPAVIEAAKTAFAAVPPGASFRLLAFGGSQGARVLADVVPAAVVALDESLRARLTVVQQAREEDVARVRSAYADAGISAEVAPFFTDLPARMAASHLIVSRSGASTVAELAAIGRPAILVPLPHALDQDQRANASVLEQAGGAFVVAQADFTPARLASDIAALINAPDRLTAMATAAKAAGTVDAAERLADLVLRVASGLDRLLNKFQIETEGLLRRLLEKYPSNEIARNIVGGPEESYIRIDVQARRLSAFIYIDGAGFQGENVDKRFEIHDYADLKQLQQAFLDTASELL